MTSLRRILLCTAAAALAACGSGGGLSEAQVSSLVTTASGVQCAPGSAEVAACSGKAAGDACSYTDARGTDTGACALAPDGTTLACRRTPPAPPAFLADACSGKASGDACTATLPNGRALTGVCGTFPGAPAGAALACERVRTPPAEATAACASLAAGAACSFTLHGYAITGTCVALPDQSLACAPGCGQMDHGGHGCDGDGDHGGGHGMGGGMGGGGMGGPR